MGRIWIRIVLFGKKYSNIRKIRIFVSTLIHKGRRSRYPLFYNNSQIIIVQLGVCSNSHTYDMKSSRSLLLCSMSPSGNIISFSAQRSINLEIICFIFCQQTLILYWCCQSVIYLVYYCHCCCYKNHNNHHISYLPRVQLIRGSWGEDRVISVIEEEDVILQSQGFVFFLKNKRKWKRKKITGCKRRRNVV